MSNPNRTVAAFVVARETARDGRLYLTAIGTWSLHKERAMIVTEAKARSIARFRHAEVESAAPDA
jgi:hypothetical protein